jgi:hypothetical protein
MQDRKIKSSTTDIITDEMWGKGSTPGQDSEVNIGELTILISVFNK